MLIDDPELSFAIGDEKESVVADANLMIDVTRAQPNGAQLMQILSTAERQVKDLSMRRSSGYLFELKDGRENVLVNAERGTVVRETWIIVQIEDLRADERSRRVATQLIAAWHVDPQPDVVRIGGQSDVGAVLREK